MVNFLPDLPRGLRVAQTTRTQGSAPVQPPVEQPPVKVEVEDSGDEAPKQETSSLSAETATESSDESHDWRSTTAWCISYCGSSPSGMRGPQS